MTTTFLISTPSHHRNHPLSSASSLTMIISLSFILSYPVITLGHYHILSKSRFSLPKITLSHHHLLHLSSSFSIIVSYHHFCPSSSVSPSLTNKLSNLWPLFSVIFSYYNPLVLPSLPMILTYCHRHPLSLLSSVTIIIFLGHPL